MNRVYKIDDFIPVKDTKVDEAIEKSLAELKEQVEESKNKSVNVGLITADQFKNINELPERIDEVIRFLGLTKTLTANQIDLVKDAIVQKFKTGMDKIEGLVKQVNEKNYSPEIKNNVVINQAEVIQAIQLMGRDVVKALNDLRIEMARKKKWEFKVNRDSGELVTSIEAVEKM